MDKNRCPRAQQWWVVINGVGNILGVYGSALQKKAEEHALCVSGERPRVGGVWKQ